MKSFLTNHVRESSGRYEPEASTTWATDSEKPRAATHCLPRTRATAGGDAHTQVHFDGFFQCAAAHCCFQMPPNFLFQRSLKRCLLQESKTGRWIHFPCSLIYLSSPAFCICLTEMQKKPLRGGGGAVKEAATAISGEETPPDKETEHRGAAPAPLTAQEASCLVEVAQITSPT